MMESDICLITGCAGLIGSEAVKKFHAEGYSIVGIDNNGRKSYFGETGSTAGTIDDFFNLKNFEFISADITNLDAMKSIFDNYRSRIAVVIHTASLPAHDTCDKNPYLACSVNVSGTINILDCVREYCPSAIFIFTSSSKVYGNRHSYLDYVEYEKRYDLPEWHELYNGIPETWNSDADDRSILGSTKLAADVLVQQYAQTYGIRSMISRPGCLTGPSHSGTTEHGFLSYLTKCAVRGIEYTIFGHKGKCIRDIWHATDMIEAFWLFTKYPKKLSIYNIGGSRHSNISTLEAIDIIEEYLGKKMIIQYNEQTRKADHKWFIGDSKKFLTDYSQYKWQYTVEETIKELCDGWKKK